VGLKGLGQLENLITSSGIDHNSITQVTSYLYIFNHAAVGAITSTDLLLLPK
jgi:hypothetical protein